MTNTPRRPATAREQQKANRNRADLAVTQDADPRSLVGSFFHGQGAPFDRTQGCVVAEPAPGVYLCEFFSWLMGESTHQRLVTIAAMDDWLFYDDAKWMTNAYEYGGVASRWERHAEEKDDQQVGSSR